MKRPARAAPSRRRRILYAALAASAFTFVILSARQFVRLSSARMQAMHLPALQATFREAKGDESTFSPCRLLSADYAHLAAPSSGTWSCSNAGDDDMIRTFREAAVQGGRVLVVGALKPWIDAASALAAGAVHVLALTDADTGTHPCGDARVEASAPAAFAFNVQQGNVLPFDVIITHGDRAAVLVECVARRNASLVMWSGSPQHLLARKWVATNARSPLILKRVV